MKNQDKRLRAHERLATEPDGKLMADIEKSRVNSIINLQKKIGRQITPGDVLCFFFCIVCRVSGCAIVVGKKQADFVGDGCAVCGYPQASAWRGFLDYASKGDS